MTDETLGDTTTEEVDDDALGADVTDVTPETTPEDFDFDEFVSGVRPGRRAVRVYGRPDLMAELEQIKFRAEQLGDDDTEDATDLMEQFREVTRQIKDSSRVFVVEARSDARTKVLMKQIGPEPGNKATRDERDEWNSELALLRLADAIITPSKVSVESLRKLREANEPEFGKLLGAFHETITNPTGGLGVNANFLRRR